MLFKCIHFKIINIIVYLEFNDVSQLNTYTKEKWEAAVEKFEQKLQPAEDLIAGKLRNLINRKKSNTVEVIKNNYCYIFYLFIFNYQNIIIHLKIANS